MKYDRTIRILHFGIMASVLLQIFGEKLVGFPEPGHPRHVIETLFIGIHEGIGSISLVLVCVYLIVVLDEVAGRERLFPWMNAAGRNSLWLEIRRDIPGWLHGKLLPPGERHFISGAIHGTGITLALFLGLTGSMLFLGIGPHGDMTPDIKMIWEYHSIMATMMLVFVAGHAGMALVHELKGHKILHEMFRLGKNHGD
ncbi:MAG: hypothetical protein BMS9Abin18_0025 [Zetaproteobacteria bacterium]|nr:MAG: hypothetical protein BMS9Abin18_0025 [Zetaproteobacteria bacterium]